MDNPGTSSTPPGETAPRPSRQDSNVGAKTAKRHAITATASPTTAASRPPQSKPSLRLLNPL